MHTVLSMQNHSHMVWMGSRRLVVLVVIIYRRTGYEEVNVRVCILVFRFSVLPFLHVTTNTSSWICSHWKTFLLKVSFHWVKAMFACAWGLITAPMDRSIHTIEFGSTSNLTFVNSVGKLKSSTLEIPFLNSGNLLCGS